MSELNESLPDQLERALAAVGQLIHHITTDQLPAATPCDEWQVRQVVTHLAGMNMVFAAMLLGEPMPPRTPIADEDLLAAYDSSARDLVTVFREPGILERDFTSPMGNTTGAERLQIRMYDLLAHGWDIARATGQPTAALPDDLADEAFVFAREQVDTLPRKDRFKPAQPCPDDADAIDRLAAFLGRDLDWQPSSAGGVDPG